MLFQFLWSVIEFAQDSEESAAVEVVPITWVTISNNIITCKWPGKNSRKAIKKQTVPLSSWETWNVGNIFLQTGNVYSNYYYYFYFEVLIVNDM